MTVPKATRSPQSLARLTSAEARALAKAVLLLLKVAEPSHQEMAFIIATLEALTQDGDL